MSQITKINGVPIANTSVSAFTYGNNVFTIGNTNGTSYSALIDTMTGLTVNGSFSATTYLGLPIDIRVTGGTYNASTSAITFTNNTGGTFNVTGITDSFTTGVTISNGRLSLLRNNGLSTLTASTITTRELTFNSNDMALNTATRATLTPLVVAVTRFAGVGAVDDAGLSFIIPNDYVGSPQFYFTWRAASTSANNAKIFLDLYTGSTNNLGSLTTSVETLSIIATPTNTNTFIFSSAATSNISFSGGNTIHARIYRDPGDGDDTYTGDLDMINFNFKYNSIS